jgi:hypothetical protein
VVLGQPLLVLRYGGDGRDGAVADGALAVCVLRLRPARLVRPEFLQRRDRLVRGQCSSHLLQLPRKQPSSPESAEPPLSPDQDADRDEVGVPVRFARIAPGKCAQPGVAFMREVDEIARQRVQPGRERLELDALEVRIAGGALPCDCVAVGVSIACAMTVLAQPTRLSCRT